MQVKILGETNFRTREFPPKWVQSRRRRKKRERKKERAKVGDNNGQATHGARKHAWRTQAVWANLFWLSIIIVDLSYFRYKI